MTMFKLRSHRLRLGLSPRRRAASAATLYAATPVKFDGSTHLTRGAALTDVSDSKVWSGSIWLRRGVTGTMMRSFTAANDKFSLHYLTTDGGMLSLSGFNSAGASVLRLDYPIADTDLVWHHVLWSFDLASAGTRQAYLNDVATGTWVTFADDAIDFTVSDVGIGADPTGVAKWNGDMADVWLRFGGSVIDFSVEANRRPFITAAGKPADPAGWPSDGQIQLYGAVGSWHINKGSAGGFTVAAGALGSGFEPVMVGAGPTGDTEAPSVPQTLIATTIMDGQIDLTWDASTDNVGVLGYNIYRDDVLIDTSPTNSYSDIGLSAGTYEYEVSAFDAADNESARSDPDSAVTPISRLLPEFVSRGTASASATAGFIGFTYPAEDVREDDLFLALIAVNDRGATADIGDTASGWTRIGEVLHSELAFAVFYKRAAGTESGAVTPFTWSSGNAANDVALCQVYQFRYVDWENGGPVVGSIETKTGNLTTLDMPSVTTQGQNGLAVAAVGFSDDLAAGLVATGATGGTWTPPRDRDTTPIADDAAVNVFVAPMAEAGTISGGSASITSSSPQSSRSAAIGFALRGMVDPGDWASAESSIAASADDAREVVATTAVVINGTTIFIPSSQIGGFRFTGLAALAGKTIVQANIQTTAGATEGSVNNATWTIKGEAADSAAQYAASNGNISGRSLTTASRSWTLPSWTLGDRTIQQRSPDIRSIVQEITDRPGFGGVVNFIITASTVSSRQIAAQDHATLQEATLTVRYLP